MTWQLCQASGGSGVETCCDIDLTLRAAHVAIYPLGPVSQHAPDTQQVKYAVNVVGCI